MMFHQGSAWALGLLAVAALACGGKVVVDGTNDVGGEGGTSTTTTGTGATTSTTSTSHTTWTSTTSTTGTGGGPGCYETYDRFTLEIRTYYNESWGCDVGGGTMTGELTLEGVINDSYPGYLLIDSCPPNADCMPMLSEVVYGATPGMPGTPAYPPIGAFVELTARVEAPWGCIHAIEIWNLPEWGGVLNPMLSARWPWLVANDGDFLPISELPYRIDPLPLGCYPGAPSCGTPKEDFVLELTDATDPFNSVQVPMGQGVEWFVSESHYNLYVHNLRSFSSGLCDDYWNNAYYATLQYYFE